MEQSEGIDPYQKQNQAPTEPRTEWYGKAKAPVYTSRDSKSNPTIADPIHPFVEPENDYEQALKDDPSLSVTQEHDPVTPAPTPAVAGGFTGYFNSWEHPIPQQDQPNGPTNRYQYPTSNTNRVTQPDSDS